MRSYVARKQWTYNHNEIITPKKNVVTKRDLYDVLPNSP